MDILEGIYMHACLMCAPGGGEFVAYSNARVLSKGGHVWN